MKRGQWQYECECGTKFWHTIGKQELSEQVVEEILANGKSSKKIVGFCSKAGNIFDACLKWENGQIGYDFESEGDGFMDAQGNPVVRETTAETTPFGPVNEQDMNEISEMIEQMHREEEEGNE